MNDQPKMQMFTAPLDIEVEVAPFEDAGAGGPDWIAKALHAARDITSRKEVLYWLPALRAHAEAFGIEEDDLLGWIAALHVIAGDPDSYPKSHPFVGPDPDRGLHRTMASTSEARARGLAIAEAAERGAAPDSAGEPVEEQDKPKRPFARKVWFQNARALSQACAGKTRQEQDEILLEFSKANGDPKLASIRQVIAAHDRVEAIRLRHPEVAKGLETATAKIAVYYGSWPEGSEDAAIAAAKRAIANKITPAQYLDEAMDLRPGSRRKRKPKDDEAASAPAEAAASSEGPGTAEAIPAREVRDPPAALPAGLEAAAFQAIARHAGFDGREWGFAHDEEGELCLTCGGAEVAVVVMEDGLTPEAYAALRKAATGRAALKQLLDVPTYVAVPLAGDPAAMKAAFARYKITEGRVIALEPYTGYVGRLA